MDASAHVFDQAIALTALGDDRFEGHTSDAYWNMVGPFGGITAATALNAVLQHPALLGQPVALTVNYAAALAKGRFIVVARAARTNRSTQHWSIEIRQDDADGVPAVVLTGSVVTAVRRETWGINDAPMPAVPAPDAVRGPPWVAPVAWIQRYEVVQLDGALPQHWDGAVSAADAAQASLSRLWMRDAPPRPIDHCALTALADVFYPRIFLRRRRRVPAGTVSMTVYFHADDAALRATADGHVLGQARAHGFGAGFHDQSAWLWNAAGQLLATSVQVVYYKE
ncbi:MAG: thioesterase family protein [Rhodoferax sp.]|nr:thioesterase family protein [Rhodoferax sp.]MCP5264439.1 thioesterase family protein [Rhodoferax sp.]